MFPACRRRTGLRDGSRRGAARFKTPEEIESVEEAARFADLGYQHFVDTIEVGMAEYELVAEVEGFLKARAPKTTSC